MVRMIPYLQQVCCKVKKGILISQISALKESVFINCIITLFFLFEFVLPKRSISEESIVALELVVIGLKRKEKPQRRS